MNISPISFKNAVKIYDTYENAQAVTKIVNSQGGNNVERMLKNVFSDKDAGEAIVYENQKGNIYILSGSDSVRARNALDAMTKIKQYSGITSGEKRVLSSHNFATKEKEKYYHKVDSFISKNPISELWVDWDKSQTRIKSFSIMW